MNPITRKEMFLAAAGGQNVTTPTPVTREEVFLDAIAKGGGGGGSSGGGVLVVELGENQVLNKTWQEINAAAFSVLLAIDPETGMKAYNCVKTIGHDLGSGDYYVNYGEAGGIYTTSSQTGYPIWHDPYNH